MKLDCNKQPNSSNLFDVFTVSSCFAEYLPKIFREQIAHFLRILTQVLINDNIKSSNNSFGSKGIAPESRPMFPGFDLIKDLIISQNTRNRHKPATKRFAQTNKIRSNTLMFKCEHLSCSAKSGLYLIADEKCIVLLA